MKLLAAYTFTVSAYAAIPTVKAEFKGWTAWNKACCILNNYKNDQDKLRYFYLKSRVLASYNKQNE